MAYNKRVYYAAQKAGVAPVGSVSYQIIHGLQTLGMTTTFNLEQAFEIGQITIYENIEGIPNIEVSMEKLLDGYCPIYCLVTQNPSTSATLAGRSKGVCSLAVAVYPEDATNTDGTPVSTVVMSGLYVNSFGYSVQVEGNAKETVTLGGHSRVWTSAVTFTDVNTLLETAVDAPASVGGSGGVNRREDVLFGVGKTRLPTEIGGLDGSGYNILTSDGYGCHVGGIDIKVTLNRTDDFELGRKGAYNRYIKWPVEVTSEIKIISASGDLIQAAEEGMYSEGGSCGSYNLLNQPIKLMMCEGLTVDCGDRNKLQSVNTTGGDAGGANQELTYTYRNFNVCTVTHPADPNHSVEGFS